MSRSSGTDGAASGVGEIQKQRYDSRYFEMHRNEREHLRYLLSFVGLRRKFAFWRSVMEMYARKPA
jgi:hypothetical protein